MTTNPLLEFSREEKEDWARYEEWLYKMDSNSRLEYAEEKGIEKGIEQGKHEAARSLLEFGDPVEKVAKVLKMPIEKVREIEDSLK